MGDLTRIDQALAIEITDGISQSAALATSLPAGAAVGVVVRDAAQGQTTMANSRPVVLASDHSDIPIKLSGAAITSATLSNVSVSNSVSTQLLASNSSRRMATFFNDGTATVYVKFGTTASATSFTVEIPSQSLYELPVPIYCGAIEALADGTTVTVRVTEM